jgi:hypothetical protein
MLGRHGQGDGSHMTYTCNRCGAENPFVNFCGCDPDNLPTVQLLTFPARPVNGGPLGKASPKFGEYACEPKANGWRALMHVRSAMLWNRHGEPLSITDTFKQAITDIRRRCADCRRRPYSLTPEWLDLEAIDRRHGHLRGTILILDVVLPGIPYEDRRTILAKIFPAFDYENPSDEMRVRLIPSHPWSQARSLYDDLQRLNDRFDPDWRKTPLNAVFEGIVGKRIDSLYPVQLRSPREEFPKWVKHRFA